MIKGRSNIFFFYLTFLLSGILTILYFSSRNLFNLNLIYQDDFPVYYFNTQIILKSLIPVFHAIFGYNLDFYAGFPAIQMYPPGIYYIMAVFSMLGVNMVITIRVILFLIIFFFILLPLYMCSKLNLHYVYGFFSSLILIIGFNQQIWLSDLNAGVLTYLSSMVFGIILMFRNIIYLFNPGTSLKELKKDVNKEEKEDALKEVKINIEKDIIKDREKAKKRKDMIINIFLLFSIVLLDYWVAILLAVFISEMILIKMLTERKFSESLRIIKYQLKYIIPAFCLLAFWLIPTLILEFPVRHSNANSYGFTIQTSYLIWPIIFNQLPIILLILIISISSIIQPKFLKKYNITWSQRENMVSIIAMSSLLITTIMPEFHIDLLLGYNSIRWYVMFELLSPVILMIFLNKIISHGIQTIKFFKKTHIRKRVRDHFRILRKKNFRFFLIIIVIIGITFIFRYKDSYIPTNNPIFNNIYPNSEIKGINYSELKSSVNDTFNWIKTNATGDSRILIEDSQQTNVIWGGYELAIAPEITNKTFIGGFAYEYWYKYSINSTCIDGSAFGVPFDQMKLNFFVDQLNFFNIQYIVVWSDEAKKFLDSYNNFTNLATFDNFSIFNFTNYNGSYVHMNDPNSSYSLLKFTDNQITVNVTNPKIGDKIEISAHDFYNWNVEVNGIKENKDPNSVYLSYTFTKNYNGTVTVNFYWRTSNLELISDVLSILSSIFMIILIIWSFLRRIWEKRKKFDKKIEGVIKK